MNKIEGLKKLMGYEEVEYMRIGPDTEYQPEWDGYKNPLECQEMGLAIEMVEYVESRYSYYRYICDKLIEEADLTFFIVCDLNGEVGKYIDGTHVVILLDTRLAGNKKETDMTVYHELAHAYLNTVLDEDQSEYEEVEGIAEGFARRCSNPDKAVKWLVGIVKKLYV